MKASADHVRFDRRQDGAQQLPYAFVGNSDVVVPVLFDPHRAGAMLDGRQPMRAHQCAQRERGPLFDDPVRYGVTRVGEIERDHGRLDIDVELLQARALARTRFEYAIDERPQQSGGAVATLHGACDLALLIRSAQPRVAGVDGAKRFCIDVARHGRERAIDRAGAGALAGGIHQPSQCRRPGDHVSNV